VLACEMVVIRRLVVNMMYDFFFFLERGLDQDLEENRKIRFSKV
jgi:hypothetical protein